MSVSAGIEPSENSLDLESLEGVDDLSLIEGLRDLFVIMLNYYKLTDDQLEKDRVKKMIWALTNKWLEKIAPINYIEGAVEKLSSIIKYKIWDVDGLDEQVINKLLLESYLCKTIVNDHTVDYEYCYNELRQNLVKVLEKLSGGEESLDDLDGVIGEGDVKEKLLNTITLTALTVTLSTNI